MACQVWRPCPQYQYDCGTRFYRMSVPGVTAHFSRIHIRNQNLSDDAAFEALLGQVRQEIGYAVERVMTAEPD